jgi:hypothetical protein
MLSWNDPVISHVGAPWEGAGAAAAGVLGAGVGAIPGGGGVRDLLSSKYIPIRTPSASSRSGTTAYRVRALSFLRPGPRLWAVINGPS